MLSTSFGRVVVTRHAIMAGSLRLAARTKVMKVTPLAAARRVLSLSNGSVSAGTARSFSSSPVVFVATKKRTATAATRKKTTAKKTTASKSKKATATKRKKTGMAAKKKKAAPKKKKKAVTKKRTTRTGKVLTPKQKAARKEKAVKAKLIAKVKDLKQTALLKEEPRNGGSSAWVLFTNQKRPELQAKGYDQKGVLTQASQEFKTLPESEMEKLRALAKANHEKYIATHEAWIKSHTPTQIAEANKARGSLKRLGLKTRHTLRDERVPKRPLTPWVCFASQKMKDRPAGSTITETLKAAGPQWASMSASQKRPYEDLSSRDKKRYEQQSQVAFGS
ncbi:uncharacterized protein MKZ38_008593 [Zalerion maritima]|uniref:HMG box domain-containing protein n=1 Tax=Zalerion maritima TaxID=339359 RepID=A0AAD5WXG5_9PEZI|nr:uncharacterized protein MKZ38_008593 [Zalerion maritima]